MSSRSRPHKHPDPSLVADEVIAPDSRTERLNTKAAGVIGLAVMCSRVLGLGPRADLRGAVRRRQRDGRLHGRVPHPQPAARPVRRGRAVHRIRHHVLEDHRARRRRAAWRLANKVATLDGARARRTLRARHGVLAPAGRGARAGLRSRTKAARTALLTRIMFPFILLVSLAALVMGMLNAKSIFGRPAMASSFFNLGSIVGGVALGYADRSRIRSPRVDRPRDRHAHRRRAAARGATAAAQRAWATASIPISTGAIRV